MPIKFSANLSFMFQETNSLVERYNLAKQCGFRAVECAFPYSFHVSDVVQAKNTAGVEQVLLNTDPGDMNKGELGFGAIIGQQEKFRKSLQLAIDYSKALDCKIIHVMSGKVPHPNAENDKVYEENLTLAASMLKSEGIVGVIEPINSISIPNYYLNSYDKGLEMVKKINSPNIKLLADLFHWQMMKIDLEKSLREAYPYIGHVQIAQAPLRNEPNTPGEIDFSKVFSLLELLGYDHWIGLEYKPANSTTSGLQWIKAMGYSL